MNDPHTTFSALEVPLDRDLFMRSLIRELSSVLEDVVGLEHTIGFISMVGQTMGDQIGAHYKEALGASKLTRPQVTEALLDLKHRIAGDFYLITQTDEQITMGCRACPFGDKVLDRRSMCMMTSNVFGTITSQNLGYAKVELAETIAAGDTECLVKVHLTLSDELDQVEGREYFSDDDE